MSERTIIAVVSDLIKTGLTVEQQILVNELVIVAAQAQREADAAAADLRREYERERKRAYREMSRDVPGQSGTKESTKENNIYINNIKPLERVQGKPLSRDNGDFDAFWQLFPRKIAKGAARKAYRNALKRASAEQILEGAKQYAASKPDPQFTKHPATWLNADCWLDEDTGKVIDFRPSAAQRTWAEIKAEREAKK